VSLTDRDRKIMLAIVPIVLLGAFWFLLLTPKRQEASTAAGEVAKQEERLEAARAAASAADNAQTGFEADYSEIVRLGKAIPSTVDMPSLLVQLDAAAEGTGIRFTSITTGERLAVAPAQPAPSEDPGDSAESEEAAPVEAGGESAQSAPGSATESANDAAQTANQDAAAAEQSGISPTDTQTSVPTSEGGLPVGGGAAVPGEAAPTAPAGLETVPLDLQFVGDFFSLADFFHDIKRFVRVANQNVVVGGRLITIDGVRWTSDSEVFPRLQVEMKATVYLSPKAEGATAGATPQGPSPTTPATTTPPAETTPAATPAPTATATP
jgi:Tfp pilus assembly protein PilO